MTKTFNVADHMDSSFNHHIKCLHGSPFSIWLITPSDQTSLFWLSCLHRAFSFYFLLEYYRPCKHRNWMWNRFWWKTSIVWHFSPIDVCVNNMTSWGFGGNPVNLLFSLNQVIFAFRNVSAKAKRNISMPLTLILLFYLGVGGGPVLTYGGYHQRKGNNRRKTKEFMVEKILPELAIMHVFPSWKRNEDQ